jgi:hypothetical protein
VRLWRGQNTNLRIFVTGDRYRRAFQGETLAEVTWYSIYNLLVCRDLDLLRNLSDRADQSTPLTTLRESKKKRTMSGWVRLPDSQGNKLTTFVQNDGLSAYMPKTLGNEKRPQENAEPDDTGLEDDEYEVEAPINGPMMAMMPTSFGKQEAKKDLSASFAKTKRAVSFNYRIV